MTRDSHRPPRPAEPVAAAHRPDDAGAVGAATPVGRGARHPRSGGTCRLCNKDVTRREDLDGLVALAVETFGKLDVLVNNAGIGKIGPMTDLDVDGWSAMIDVNLRGVLYGIAAALPVFRRQGQGHFVTTVSTSGVKIVPTQAVYAATKNAVRTPAGRATPRVD